MGGDDANLKIPCNFCYFTEESPKLVTWVLNKVSPIELGLALLLARAESPFFILFIIHIFVFLKKKKKKKSVFLLTCHIARFQ